MANRPRHTVAGALSTCLTAASLSPQDLAKCLIGHGFAPVDVADESRLAQALSDIVAGTTWPFSVGDTAEFFRHCQDCLRNAGIRNLFALSLIGAILVKNLILGP